MSTVFDSQGGSRESPVLKLTCEETKRQWDPNNPYFSRDVSEHLWYCKACKRWWRQKTDEELEREGKALATVKRLFEALDVWMENDSPKAREDGYFIPGLTLEQCLDEDGWGPWEEHQEREYWYDYLNDITMETFLGD